MMYTVIACVCAVRLAVVHGHGSLVHPRSRQKRSVDFATNINAPQGAVHLWHMLPQNYWYSQGCMIGCAECHKNCNPEAAGAGDPGESGGYVGPCCTTLMEPLLGAYPTDPRSTWKLKTITGDHPEYLVSNPDPFKYNPWRAPGHAPIMDACGIGGGAIRDADWALFGTVGNDGVPPVGFRAAQKGTELKESEEQVTWTAGSTVEVSWAPTIANHGGGYQYRLCPSSSELTEECFQRTPLQPAGKKQWIQYYSGNLQTSKDRIKNNRTEINAVFVTEGVKPAGSTWIRNPFPACEGLTGGEATHPCKGPMFKPPPEMPEDWFGYGLSRCQNATIVGSVTHSCDEKEWEESKKHYNFAIIDNVVVPESLASGKYVLSWRWDVEQSPQVWSNCADVLIEAPADAAKPQEDSSIWMIGGVAGVLGVFAILGVIVMQMRKTEARTTGRYQVHTTPPESEDRL